MTSLVAAVLERRTEESREAELQRDRQAMRQHSVRQVGGAPAGLAAKKQAEKVARTIRAWEADRDARAAGIARALERAHEQYRRLRERQAREEAARREKAVRAAEAESRRKARCAQNLIDRGYGFVVGVK